MDNIAKNNGEMLLDSSSISLLKLLLTFLKIGAFTFGGGYAMLPMIQREIVHRLKWIETETFMDILVISQTLPGPLALNCSIIVGRRLRGTSGGLAAALGAIIPSFITISVLVAFLLPVIYGNKYMQAILYGLRPAAVALVAAAAFELAKNMVKNRLSMILLALLILASLKFSVHPVLILTLGALLGLFFRPGEGKRDTTESKL